MISSHKSFAPQLLQVHLNWKIAQNMPLFLPMVLSVELMVSTFPWAVHKTETEGKKSVIIREKAHLPIKTVISVYLLLLIQQAQMLRKSSTYMDK